MKKITILIAVCVCSLFANAQDARFTIGSKFGFGHSYMMPYKNSVFHSSWLAGLTTAYQLGENWAVGADALYSSEGATFKSVLTDVTTSTELDYLRVPLKVMYLMGTAEKSFRPKFSVGPTFGVLMAEGTGYKDMDLGAQASLGFNYEMLDQFWLSTDVTYYHGLMDIYAGNADNERNGNIRLEIGLIFGL